MKKIVAIVPIKSISKRLKKKNFRSVGGKPLYRHLLDKLNKTNFDEVYIDSDSAELENYCKSKGYQFIKRQKKLSKDNANGNDLLNYHSKIIDADYYFQLFVTAPLLSVESINDCIKLLDKKKNIDSILTIKEIYSWFWFKNKPVNYKPDLLPRSQDASPIIQETTGLYGIKKEALRKYKCRIGKKPFFYKINDTESIDIDTEQEFKILNDFFKRDTK